MLSAASVVEIGVPHCAQECVPVGLMAARIKYLHLEAWVGLAKPPIPPTPDVRRVLQCTLVDVLRNAGSVAAHISAIGMQNSHVEPLDLTDPTLYGTDRRHGQR
jgi:hypothetical protein